MIRRWPNRVATLFLVLPFLFISLTQASAQRRERVVDAWRPLHYNVSLTLDDQIREIASARTEITVAVLKPNQTTIAFDFGGLKVDSVTAGHEPARFEHALGLLNVRLPQPAKQGDQIIIAVSYHGRPEDGLILTTDRDGKPSATGDNWPDRVHQWIPCLDHPSAKATVTFTVTAPQRELVVANGQLNGETKNADGTATWSFIESRPIPPYCMVISVNEGVKLDAQGLSEAPLSYYVPQVDRDYAPRGFAAAAPAMTLFSDTIAPYPYEKLALIIGATRFGGMENSSAIVFTSSLFDLRRGEPMSNRFGIPMRIEDVVSHEIAHQWFGDSVTESTWADLWLSEGFATYFAGLFIEKYDGEDAFRAYMRHGAGRYFNYEQRRRAPIHDTETGDLNNLLNPNNYEKAAWVLHMLRRRLGDEAFFRGLRDYYNAHRNANATTEDLRDSLEKASGQKLHDFFARWVYGTGHPKYELSWTWKDKGAKGGLLAITLRQRQLDEAFLDPVPLEVVTSEGKERITFQPSGKTTMQQFQIARRPGAVRVDPDETILKEVAQ